jgi:regulator of sirC expression with transglutaminase-like and TPR domain
VEVKRLFLDVQRTLVEEFVEIKRLSTFNYSVYERWGFKIERIGYGQKELHNLYSSPDIIR